MVRRGRYICWARLSSPWRLRDRTGSDGSIQRYHPNNRKYRRWAKRTRSLFLVSIVERFLLRVDRTRFDGLGFERVWSVVRHHLCIGFRWEGNVGSTRDRTWWQSMDRSVMKMSDWDWHRNEGSRRTPSRRQTFKHRMVTIMDLYRIGVDDQFNIIAGDFVLRQTMYVIIGELETSVKTIPMRMFQQTLSRSLVQCSKVVAR